MKIHTAAETNATQYKYIEAWKIVEYHINRYQGYTW